ncbi:cilia- and flagella-associated protein 70 isoform X2 [Lingula anatina]|uniref:Cilia- and flagella-associated protein 70 isoform X2 n=1 Tax=Lingula anatina TaxID=7574 RepID=A0A1S3J8T5_LINAN|nr:cilia- and flagella-associated protein 70 isoform X2 [Lingula anatina]|eukprot:XP_013406723.1 cilia- and flagella-associated protein 70 isoform X2 [Lingula anatina]
MADSEVPQTRSPEPLTITVLRARNLRGLKGENLNSLVRVEFGDKALGETPKVECTAEVAAEYNFSTTITATFDDPLSLDELSHKPILFTVVEVLPKEKKQKEEKTINLGQCTADLLPLIRGELKHKYTLPVYPVQASPMENLPPEHPRPEIDVVISVENPLLTEQQLSECNLMQVTIESLYSPPDAWQLTGPQYMYLAAMPMPLTAEKEQPIVYASGTLKPGVEKEPPNKQKKWFVGGNAQGQAAYIPDSFLSEDPVEEEDGDFRAKTDRDHREVSEHDKNRVTWNTEKRCYLDASGTKSLQEKIAKTRYWPLEVMRIPLPAGGKGKKLSAYGLRTGSVVMTRLTSYKLVEEEGTISYHGIVYVNMAPLLYPGVKRIRGAYKVYAYSDNEMAEKTKRRGGLAEEAAKIATGMLARNATSPFPKKGGKDADKKEPVKKGASAMLKAADSTSQLDGEGPVNVEGQQYVDSKSYVTLEIVLHRALVRRRQPEELAKRVAEYIPPRPLFPKRTNGAQRAVEDFHNQIASVFSMALDEFREKFADELGDTSVTASLEDMEKRRQKLIFDLNSSGKYFAFKEQLKHAVVKIVREKYLKTTSFATDEELQAFLSELYVYLMDQMHIGLSKVLSLEDKTPVPEPLATDAQLKHFAREAEVNENFELAAKYYQERIARNKADPEAWFDYGTFCLYISDIPKAEECFKECIAINQRHFNGLILYGVVCAMEERNDAAETFFETATRIDPHSTLAWTMLGLFYDGIGNDIQAEMAFLEAQKQNVYNAKQELLASQPPVKEREEAGDHFDTSPSKETTRPESPGKTLPEIKQTPATPAAPSTSKTQAPASRKMSLGKKPVGPGSMGSRTSSKDNVNSNHPGSRPSSRHARSPVPTPLQTEEEPPRIPTPVPKSSIYMNAVEWLLEAKAAVFTERALAHELLSPSGGPSADYHITLARLHIHKKEFPGARLALNEALQIDHENPDAWAFLGHLNYLSGNLQEAKGCYERTLSFIGDPSESHSIYLRLASIYLEEGQFLEAKKTFLMACKKSASCVSWLGVGIACYRLGELSESEDALSEANILNNTDPEVWAYLSLVCLKTERQLEAEQAYKYALKLHLQDEDLLNELHQVQQEVGFGNPEL